MSAKKPITLGDLQYYTEELTAKYHTLFSSPLVASTAAAMTDTEKVYVYTGSESGYTAGNWYYYNGSAWVSGGVYNALAISDNSITDAKLVQNGGVYSAIYPTESLIPVAYAMTPNYIQTNGSISNSANWRTYWFHASDVKSISKVESYGSNVTYNQIAFYNSLEPSNSSFISGYKFTTTSGKTTTNDIEIPATAVLILVVNRHSNGTDIAINGKNSLSVNKGVKNPWEKFDKKFMLIGYSRVTNPYNYEINTEEMYDFVGASSYDAIKGDVRITSDNKLVMSHDAGFTLDGSGKIISFNSSNYTAIHDMTLSQVQALVFAQQTSEGADMHVPTFEQYLKMCKKHGKICFITIRDEYIDTVAPIVLSLLETFKLKDNAIINSLTYQSLQIVRSLDPYIPVVYTVDIKSTDINMQNMNDVAKLGYSAFGAFASNGGATSVSTLATVLQRNSEEFEILQTCGVRIIGAIAAKQHLDSYLGYNLAGVQSIDEWE